MATAIATPVSPMQPYLNAFDEWSAVVGKSAQTRRLRRHSIERFIEWADERGITRVQDVSRAVMERYQRHLFHYRKRDGQPLSIGAQLNALTGLKRWFAYLSRQNHLLYNPAAELELPRAPKALPRALLSVAQIETLLASCDLGTLSGVRLRAIMEVLYSTGIRRFELAGLKSFEVDTVRGSVMVRLGKGAKDRLVPLGERASRWVEKYRDEVRPELAARCLTRSRQDEHTLFLNDRGCPFDPRKLGDAVKRQMQQVDIHTEGACHLFRVACATHMLENGADIRFIQTLLGHAKLDTTQIYTQVSLAKLKEVHNATHPAKLTRAPGATQTSLQGAQNAFDTANLIEPDFDAPTAFLEALRGEVDE